MDEKDEFLALRSKISRFLKNAFRVEKPGLEIEAVSDSGTDNVEKTDNNVADNLDKVTRTSVPIGFAEELNIERIASFREKIEKGFADSLAATTPWIKLGIDLGTSSSKVVWRGDTNVFPVCFGPDPLRLESYLEPSLVTFKDNCLLFGVDALESSTNQTVSNFKMCLACVSQDSSECNTTKCSLTTWPIEHFCAALKDQEIQFINATYLGKLIAKAKTIIANELSREFRQVVVPKWTANLAVPEVFVERSPVANEFKKILRTGWLMSEIFIREPSLKDRISLFECYLAASDLAWESLGVLNDEEFGCSIYPEVGAEVASIVMSRLSEEGLYAFIDIGAGTIDASFFNYYREGGKPNRPPYAAAVSKDLGAAQIEVQASRTRVGTQNFEAAELKHIKEIYNGLPSNERNDVRLQFHAMKRVVRMLQPKIQSFLQNVFRDARNEKDSHIVNKKIRLVIGGGGSQLNVYKNAAIDAFTIKHATLPIVPEETVLQKPGDFQMTLPDDHFHRFAVAYGLSYPVEDLPEMVFPKDVERKAGPKQPVKNHGAMYEK